MGLASIAVTAAVAIAANGAFKDIVTPVENIKFPPLQPLGTSTAVGVELWKDSATGRLSELIKMTRGTSPRHYHTFDYQMVVVKGSMTHSTDRLPEADATRLGPGSYWFQPANVVHQSTCLVDECIIFWNTFAGGETKNVESEK